MKRALVFVAAAALAVGVLGTVSAHEPERKNVTASLDGYQEVPSISTAGAGRFRLSVNEARTSLSFELSYAGLEGGVPTAAHIHFGQRAVAGGVIADLCGGSRPACPASPGTVTGTIVAGNVVGPAVQGIAPGEFDEVLRAVSSGNTYVNVHTPLYPNGEIRGQIKGQIKERGNSDD